MRIADDVTKAVGHTPLIRINRIIPAPPTVCAKLESCNPGGSIKDRTAVAIVDAAEAAGQLSLGGTIVEATSGNTGIGLAMVGAARGYKVILTMPESMSKERRMLLKALGATLVLTPAPEGMNGAVAKAQELAQQDNAILASQFENPANPMAHHNTTAQEIWDDTEGQVDIVVAGVGTGGTISGIGAYLKAKKPSVQMVAVEPTESPILSGGLAGAHKIQGIGANFVPQNFKRELVDEIITVNADAAVKCARLAATKEGLMVGISAGAALAAAAQIARRPENENKLIVVILPDTGERYMSTILFEGLVD